MPEVSVIVPAYNAERYLEECLTLERETWSTLADGAKTLPLLPVLSAARRAKRGAAANGAA